MAEFPLSEQLANLIKRVKVDVTAIYLALNGKAPSTHVGAGGTEHSAATGALAGFMSSGDKTKLDGVAAGATANSPDATLLARANHTGLQAISTVTNLQSSLDAKANANAPTFTGNTSFTSANAGIELGSTSTANTPYMDFHTSGVGNDFDARLIASGGTGAGGDGELMYQASRVAFTGVVQPGTFTVATLPTGALAASIAYASNGRKVGEGAGAGTGVLVYRSNSAWRVYSTDAAVAT